MIVGHPDGLVGAEHERVLVVVVGLRLGGQLLLLLRVAARCAARLQHCADSGRGDIRLTARLVGAESGHCGEQVEGGRVAAGLVFIDGGQLRLLLAVVKFGRSARLVGRQSGGTPGGELLLLLLR